MSQTWMLARKYEKGLLWGEDVRLGSLESWEFVQLETVVDAWPVTELTPFPLLSSLAVPWQVRRSPL